MSAVTQTHTHTHTTFSYYNNGIIFTEIFINSVERIKIIIFEKYYELSVFILVHYADVF